MKKVLLDTHILIRRESDQTIGRHLREVKEYADKLHYELVIHPRSVEEIKMDKNIPNSRKRVLLSKMGLHPPLDSVSNPLDDEDFLRAIQGLDRDNFRDVGDAFLIYCLYKKEVDLLLTEDSDLIEKAGLLNIAGRVMTLKDAAMNFKGKRPDDVPVFHFYKEGDMWYIGEDGKKAPSFEHLDGFGYIHFLLRHQNQKLHPLVLYHRGKTAGDKTSDHKVSIEEAESLGLHSEGGVNTYDRTDIRKNKHLIKQAIQRLREKRENTSSSDEAMEITEKIDQYEEALNRTQARDYKSPVEKARVNVTKGIKAAMERIKKDKNLTPIYKDLESTITTGDNFSYFPLDNEKPIWILYPDSE